MFFELEYQDGHFSASMTVLDRKRSKFQQPRFLGMQLQVELPHSLAEFRPELFGIRFALESNHDIVSKSHDGCGAGAP
jgi:hypothetical protein